MRVAIIAEVFLPKVDGVVSRTLNLIRELKAQGDDVLIVCPSAAAPLVHGTDRSGTDKPGCRENRDVFPVTLLEFLGFPCPSYPEYIIGRPDDRLIRGLEDFQPDVIHFLNPFAFGFQCNDLLRKAGYRVPTLYSFHTLYGEFVRQYRGLKPLSRVLWWLMRRYHNTADMNLTVSSVMLEELRARGFERVELWPPAVDSVRFCPTHRSAEMRNRLCGDRPDAPLLLTVSRLAPEKNVGFLAEVIRQLPGVNLAVVGDGPQRTELEQRFQGTSTHFTGVLQGQELAAAYASADAFLYASETETMGNVILEAMASGLPAICANAGGVPSLLRHGIDGFLYPPRDVEQAVHLTRQLMVDSDRRRQMSQQALISAGDRTWGQAALRVRGYYQQVIDSAAAVSDVPGTSIGRPGPGWPASRCTSTLVRMFQLAARSSARRASLRNRELYPALSSPNLHQSSAAAVTESR